MVKVKSLDHTRFVITATTKEVPEFSRKMYFAGGISIGAKMGDWCTDLGGAAIYNDLHAARMVMKELRNHHNRWSVQSAERGPKLNFNVVLVQNKDVMVARLKYDGETI